MKLHRYHAEAEVEFLEQVAYYEAIAPGLGQRFMTEVKAALDRVGNRPKYGSPYFKKTRRVFPKGFGFSLAYYEGETELFVMAVASFSRKPGYWRRRKNES